MQGLAKTMLAALGCVSLAISLLLFLLIVDMIQHPGGAGMGKLIPALFGLTDVAFLLVGILLWRVVFMRKTSGKRLLPATQTAAEVAR